MAETEWTKELRRSVREDDPHSLERSLNTGFEQSYRMAVDMGGDPIRHAILGAYDVLQDALTELNTPTDEQCLAAAVHELGAETFGKLPPEARPSLVALGRKILAVADIAQYAHSGIASDAAGLRIDNYDALSGRI